MLTSVTFEIFSCHNDIIAEVFNTIRIYIHLKSDIRISLTLPYTIQQYMLDHCTTALCSHHTVLFLSLNIENLSISLFCPCPFLLQSQYLLRKLILHEITIMYKSEICIQFNPHIRCRNLYHSAPIFSSLIYNTR